MLGFLLGHKEGQGYTTARLHKEGQGYTMARLPAVSFYSSSSSGGAAAAASISTALWVADLPRREGKTGRQAGVHSLLVKAIRSRTSSHTHGRLGGWESKSPSRRNMHWAALFACEILPGSGLAWSHTNCSCPPTVPPIFPLFPAVG